jgi:NDP-sugar pyrophosphorylase family protein
MTSAPGRQDVSRLQSFRRQAMQDLSSLTAAILVGGLGTRLRSVLADRPKVLAEVHGRPFLSYLLDQLADAGLRTVVLCTGYMGQKVQAAFGDCYRGLRLIYSQEAAPMGTGGALRFAVEHIVSPTALVLNGDSYCQADLAGFWNVHYGTGARATLVLAHVDDASRFGQVDLDEAGQVVRFQEKDAGGGPGWINAGIYLIDKGWIAGIPAGTPVSLERESFPGWIGQRLYGWRSYGRFLDIGTPESYRDAEQFLAARGGE